MNIEFASIPWGASISEVEIALRDHGLQDVERSEGSVRGVSEMFGLSVETTTTFFAGGLDGVCCSILADPSELEMAFKRFLIVLSKRYGPHDAGDEPTLRSWGMTRPEGSVVSLLFLEDGSSICVYYQSPRARAAMSEGSRRRMADEDAAAEGLL